MDGSFYDCALCEPVSAEITQSAEDVFAAGDTESVGTHAASVLRFQVFGGTRASSFIGSYLR